MVKVHRGVRHREKLRSSLRCRADWRHWIATLLIGSNHMKPHGPGERTRLVAQDVEIMLEVQHVLAPPIAALVTRHSVARVPDLDMQR